MAIEAKPGQALRLTITKHINRASARKTIERLFLRDRTIRRPIEVRSRNFIELPKRRGGQIWTKRPNKVHPTLTPGASAAITATAQAIRDLNSVEAFVQVRPA